uniref:Ankyrin repeat domain-containing protein 27 n=1 Tax=Cajanus cajan TaxID=3821 RepID=A0A151RUL6_CAJCA|nr:Ankyrin repeat domain-containing protein 27 [Cajanus cajan]
MGNTVLHVAAQWGNDDWVKKITKNPFLSHLLHAENKNGDTPLHVAARYGHVSTLSNLFVACLSNLPFLYSENPKKAVEVILARNKQGNTFFHEALLKDRKDVMSMLHSEETSIEVGFKELVERVALYTNNNDGKSVLYLAIERGYKEFVCSALEKLRFQHYALDELIQNHQELDEMIPRAIPTAKPLLPYSYEGTRNHIYIVAR